MPRSFFACHSAPAQGHLCSHTARCCFAGMQAQAMPACRLRPRNTSCTAHFRPTAASATAAARWLSGACMLLPLCPWCMRLCAKRCAKSGARCRPLAALPLRERGRAGGRRVCCRGGWRGGALLGLLPGQGRQRAHRRHGEQPLLMIYVLLLTAMHEDPCMRQLATGVLGSCWQWLLSATSFLICIPPCCLTLHLHAQGCSQEEVDKHAW